MHFATFGSSQGYFLINIRLISSTVYIGFCNQPPSEGSGSLNPKEVAKLSGFQLDIKTRWSQNTGLMVARPWLIGYSDYYRSLFTT